MQLNGTRIVSLLAVCQGFCLYSCQSLAIDFAIVMLHTDTADSGG